MICRKYELEFSLNRKNILYFPVIITIIFGFLVNLVCNKINSLPDFATMFQELQTIDTTKDNFFMLIILYIVLASLFVLIIIVFILVFFIPFPPLLLIIEAGQTKEYQIKYELEILDKKIKEKLNINKNGKDYKNIKKKYNTKYLFGISIIIVLIIAMGTSWGITFDKICFLTVAGIVGGYFISKI